MANSVFCTREGAVSRAKLIQAALANCVLRFTDGFTPGPLTDRTTLLANETAFTGYPTGGYPMAAWTGPGAPSSGGAVITSPTVPVTIVDATPPAVNTPANLQGWWIETKATAPAVPDVLLAGSISPAITMASSLDQFPFVAQDWEGLMVAPPTSS